jgi:hypothetical protein
MEGVVLVTRWRLASANTLTLAPHLDELLADAPTCTWTCNQRERLTAIASAHPMTANHRAQRQMSASGVCMSHLQPSRGPTIARRAPTSVVGDSCAQAPAHHDSSAEFCVAAAAIPHTAMLLLLRLNHTSSKAASDGSSAARDALSSRFPKEEEAHSRSTPANAGSVTGDAPADLSSSKLEA